MPNYIGDCRSYFPFNVDEVIVPCTVYCTAD